MRVTLLGTGCPIADIHRYGPATLVEAGDERWLIDCGSGVSQRLLAHGANGARLTGLLLTHLHSDHTADLIQLLISGWHQGRDEPLRIFGPKRTLSFVKDLLHAWQPEFEQRLAWEMRSADGLQVDVQEIGNHWTLETPNLRITNTEVRHHPIPQAFGFRFDMLGSSAVISGDTAYSPELIKLAKGADLLVHEAFVHHAYGAARQDRNPKQRGNVAAYHTSTDEVGKVAKKAGVRHLALTHFVPTIFDREQVMRDVGADYSGGFSIGEDLMCFDVEKKRVSLLRSGVRGHL